MTQTTSSAPTAGGNKPNTSTIRLKVIYPAAVQPYKDDEADRNMTVGQVKAAALNAFGLVETAAKPFKLFHGQQEFANLTQPIGEIAGTHQELVFQLEELIAQG
jgi:hypothetical protein